MKKVKRILLAALVMTLLVGGGMKLMEDGGYFWVSNTSNETVQL